MLVTLDRLDLLFMLTLTASYILQVRTYMTAENILHSSSIHKRNNNNIRKCKQHTQQQRSTSVFSAIIAGARE